MRKTYFLLLLWACPMAAAAGPDGRADTLAYQLDGVVVTANKWRQPKYTLTRREGHGSTFYISLPYEPMDEEDEWDEV